MTEPKAPKSTDYSQCPLCQTTFHLSLLVRRGELNLCHPCADRMDRAIAPKGSPWLKAAAIVVVLGSVAGAGFLGWHSYSSQQRPIPPPAPAAPAATPAPAAEAPAAPEVSASLGHTLEATTNDWIQRVFGNVSPKQVVDVGAIHLLFVSKPGTGGYRGLTSRLYVTREAPSDGAQLVTAVGKEMKISFDEGLRYVRKLPRDWEKDFALRLSFEDKFTPKDGGSAGAGFTLAMLAGIQRFQLDPDLAITGDLTIDGAVQPVGAVVEKLRGAIEGKCKITLVPERNSRDVVDMALLDGTEPLWETQIFSIKTIDDGAGLVRTDRAEAARAAIDRFNQLRARLPAVVTPNYLQSPIVQTELHEVLKLAPNHLSAATLLQAAEHRLPKQLSLNRSVEEILTTSYLFIQGAIATAGKGDGTAKSAGISLFPEREFSQCVKKLSTLTPMLDPRSIELKTACVQYTGALRAGALYTPATTEGIKTPEQLFSVASRERGFQKDIVQEYETGRSRLVLAIHKLQADGDLYTELLKK